MSTSKIKNCQKLLDKCKEGGKSSHLLSRVFEVQLAVHVKETLVKKFWMHFPKKLVRSNSHTPFLKAVEFLMKSCDKIEQQYSSPTRQSMREKIFHELRLQILSTKPYHLNDYLEATYIKAFRTFLNLERAKNQNNSSMLEDDFGGDYEDEYDEVEEEVNDRLVGRHKNSCKGCSQTKEHCKCGLDNTRFFAMNRFLNDYGLLEGLVGDTVMNISKMFIERKVATKGKSNYSFSYLDDLSQWVQNVVQRFILDINGITEQREIDKITGKLNQYLKEAYAEVRVSHMFEIIIEYPNSEASIQDLKTCLEQATSPNFRINLIESVKQSLVESLLHPGVNTFDILTAYISSIKALRALDPTGLILQLVTDPVRRYLKSRDDTVRCIVTALTDEEHNSELNREMIRTSTQTNENGLDGKSGAVEMTIPSEGEKCTASNFEKWKPDPIKLNSTDDLMKSSRFSDIVSILVNIYETKDLFVEEYQKLLSHRLLNKYDECNLDTELRNLELLTVRFSDCELHRCEVMLKDVQTSKRINKRILSGDIREHKLEKFRNLDVLIVSSPFWPDKFSPMATLSDEPPTIDFPEEINSAINTYTKAFESIQASRTLHWRHHFGTVNLDLKMNDKIQNFNVTPLHASLLYLFKEKTSWRLNELMHRTSLPAATLRSRLALWKRNYIINELTPNKFDLSEKWR